MAPSRRLTVVLSELLRTEKEVTAMDENTDDKWLTRQDLADRYGLPVKTPAEWASKGTGPRYAKFGRHVRYRLSDVIDWEGKQFAGVKRTSA
nr:helix-turn-helix domain-containing protein [Mycobacterium sherrisii]